jgi:WD40 repeat protein
MYRLLLLRWDVLGSGKCLRTYMGHSKGVRDITFSNDGKRFVSTGYDKNVHVWDTETGQVGAAAGHGALMQDCWCMAAAVQLGSTLAAHMSYLRAGRAQPARTPLSPSAGIQVSRMLRMCKVLLCLHKQGHSHHPADLAAFPQQAACAGHPHLQHRQGVLLRQAAP